MSQIQTKAMLASLSISMFSPKKTDKRVTRQVIDQHHASESAGKFVKQLLPEEALEAIKKLQNEARQYHYENTLPWSDEGARILPSAHYMTYVDKMRKFGQQFEPLVEAFLDRYEEYKETSRQRLNGMYNPDDYPSKDRVRRKFKFKSAFLPFPDGADFRVEMADDEMTALRSEMEIRVKEASETARNDLWQRLAGPLKMMVDRLSDPKAKIYDTLVTNVREIVDLIPALNVTGDTDLERIRQQVKSSLAWTNPDTLRKSPSTRAATAAKANEILATMSGYLTPDSPAPAPAPFQLLTPEPELAVA